MRLCAARARQAGRFLSAVVVEKVLNSTQLSVGRRDQVRDECKRCVLELGKAWGWRSLTFGLRNDVWMRTVSRFAGGAMARPPRRPDA